MLIKNVIRLRTIISHWLWSGATAVGSMLCIVAEGINQIASSNINMSQGFQFPSFFTAGKFGVGSGNTLNVVVFIIIIILILNSVN